MASIIREIIIDAAPEHVWETVSDFANGPVRMAPGMLTDCRLDEPDIRTLVFADGTIARERLIGRDEQVRRIVWGWVGDQVSHDNASMQVFAEDGARSRLVWIHDTLPDGLTDWLATAMDRIAPVFQQALKSSSTGAA